MNKNNVYRLPIISINSKVDNNKISVTLTYWNPLLQRNCKAKGISKCNPNDTFDTTKGYRIAESRAKINMYQTYYTLVTLIMHRIQGKHAELEAHELRHLDNIINDNVHVKK